MNRMHTWGGSIAHRAAAMVSAWLLLAAVSSAHAQAAPADAAATPAPAVGIVEKLGDTIPLDLTFNNEAGEEVTLGALIDKPVILNLIYLRCPNICSPLLQEVAAMVAKVDLKPGQDYRVITVSFDPREGPEIAKNGKTALLSRTSEKYEREIPAESWAFLTGTAENSRALADAVGFYYQEDNGDYNHPATTIFLSDKGKIVRYLNGTELLAANVKLALIDAMEGRPRSVMQVVQALCFSYEQDANAYVLKINRVILLGTILFLGVFLLLLLFFRRHGKTQVQSPEETK
ncbi:MAG: SCO family protein [Verrucomicrobiota bacterium]|nr:SCO family protein [Verrucomicrobiota bacterium]